MNSLLIFCLCSLHLLDTRGVFGAESADAYEMEAVLVTEGDTVTLSTNLSEIQKNDQIVWMFGPKEARITEIYKEIINMFDSNVKFGDRLKMDNQTGSLTIRNSTAKHFGLYKLQIVKNTGTSYKKISLTIFARLPVPVISSKRCSLVCSVVNVSDVSLSWYKGNSLLSNISVSDLKNILSLPLEIESQDNNTYSCVVNNTIRNQTTHLNISQTCQPRAETSQRSHMGLLVSVMLVMLFVVILLMAFMLRSRKRLSEKSLFVFGRCQPTLI